MMLARVLVVPVIIKGRLSTGGSERVQCKFCRKRRIDDDEGFSKIGANYFFGTVENTNHTDRNDAERNRNNRYLTIQSKDNPLDTAG